jgi:hypothetical protein
VPYPTGKTFGIDELSREVASSGLDVDDATAIMHIPRLVVRPLVRLVAGRPEREAQLVSTLLGAEPPRGFPLRTVTGQFIGVRATRPREDRIGRGVARKAGLVSAALNGGPRDIVMRGLGRTVYRRLVWMEMDLRRDGRVFQTDAPLEFSFLAQDDVKEIAAFRPGLGIARIRARFARGDRCYCARYDGRIASLSWIASGEAPIEYLQARRALEPGAVYCYDRYTNPAMRGHGIAPVTGSRVCRMLADEGFQTFAAVVHPENRAAMRHALRLGLRPVATVGWAGPRRLRRFFRRALAC